MSVVRSMMSSIRSVVCQPVAVGRLDADAPGAATVGDDLVGEGDQLVPRRRHGVARGLEGLDRIPDDRLDVDLVGEAPGPVSVGVQRHGRRVRLGEQLRASMHGGDVEDLRPLLAVLVDGGGLGQLDDVRCRAAVERHVDERLVLAGRDRRRSSHVDAGGLLERRDGGLEVVRLTADPLGLHGDLGSPARGWSCRHSSVEIGDSPWTSSSWATTPMLLNVRAIVASAVPAMAVLLCAWCIAPPP